MANSDGSAEKTQLARTEQAAIVLRQAAGRAANLDETATRLVAYGNEQAAALEQVRASMDSVAAGVEETSKVVHSMARAQQALSDTAKDVLGGLEGTTTGIQELATSFTASKKDGDQLAASADGAASTVEELARSIKAVSANA